MKRSSDGVSSAVKKRRVSKCIKVNGKYVASDFAAPLIDGCDVDDGSQKCAVGYGYMIVLRDTSSSEFLTPHVLPNDVVLASGKGPVRHAATCGEPNCGPAFVPFVSKLSISSAELVALIAGVEH
eukprot:5124586-Karenia_brevis.AAC.1